MTALELARAATVREDADLASSFVGLLNAGASIWVTDRRPVPMAGMTGRTREVLRLEFERLDGQPPQRGWISEEPELFSAASRSALLPIADWLQAKADENLPSASHAGGNGHDPDLEAGIAHIEQQAQQHAPTPRGVTFGGVSEAQQKFGSPRPVSPVALALGETVDGAAQVRSPSGIFKGTGVRVVQANQGSDRHPKLLELLYSQLTEAERQRFQEEKEAELHPDRVGQLLGSLSKVDVDQALSEMRSASGGGPVTFGVLEAWWSRHATRMLPSSPKQQYSDHGSSSNDQWRLLQELNYANKLEERLGVKKPQMLKAAGALSAMKKDNTSMVRAKFKEMDTERGFVSEVLSKKEFRELLKKIDGKAMQAKQLTEVFESLAGDEPDPELKQLVVDYPTFETWFLDRLRKDVRAARVLASSIFQAADADGSGLLDKEEVGSVVTLIKSKFPHISLNPPFHLERDFAQMTGQEYVDPHEVSHTGSRDDADNGSGGDGQRKKKFVTTPQEVTWEQFEQWWRERSGDDEGTVPVLPEALVLRVNDVAAAKAGGIDAQEEQLRRALLNRSTAYAAEQQRAERSSSASAKVGGLMDPSALLRRGSIIAAEGSRKLLKRAGSFTGLTSSSSSPAAAVPAHAAVAQKLSEDELGQLGRLQWKWLKPRLISLVQQQRIWGTMNELGGTRAHSAAVLPQGIRSPHSTGTRQWDVVQFFAIIYIAVVLPFRVSFNTDVAVGSGPFFVDVFIDLFFICDLISNFRLAYVIEDGPRLGQLETSTKAIRNRYFRGWFAIDFISSVPIQYVAPIVGVSMESVRNAKVVRLTRLFKMLRVARIMKVIDRSAQFADWTVAMSAFISFCGIIYTCHLLACFWYLFGSNFDDDKVGWVHRILNQKSLTCPLCPNITLGNRYMHSLFTVLLMGDTSAVSVPEKSFGVFSYAVIIIIQGTLAGIMSQLLMASRVGEQEYIVKLAQLKAWMKKRQMPPERQRQIMHHFTAQNQSSTYFDEADILTNYLPTNLSRQVSLQLYHATLYRSPLFRMLGKEVMVVLCQAWASHPTVCCTPLFLKASRWISRRIGAIAFSAAV